MNEDPIKIMLRRLPYGFYSITSKHGDEVNAMVANWIVQTSFEPRMLALGLQRTSYSYELISKGKVFTVNLFLRQDVEALKPFTKSRSKNPEKMSGVDYSPAPETGCPIIPGAAGYLECQVKEIFTTGGDHDIILGEVIGAEVLKEGSVDDTLTLFDLGWSYAGQSNNENRVTQINSGLINKKIHELGVDKPSSLYWRGRRDSNPRSLA